MTRPMRPSRKAAFTDDEEKIAHERDKMDDVLEALTSRSVEPARLQAVPALPVEQGEPPAAPQVIVPVVEDGPTATVDVGERALAEPTPAVTEPASPDEPAPVTVANTPDEKPAATASAAHRDRKPQKAVGPAKQGEETRKKPPAAWISADVYRHLVAYSDEEKREKRAGARPFGVIAMDAIENHANILASAWKGSGAGPPRPGKLFVAEAHSRYRRHDAPPRSITLQGIGPENARLLKKLMKQWGAGSVSDLVEKALRLELGMG